MSLHNAESFADYTGPTTADMSYDSGICENSGTRGLELLTSTEKLINENPPEYVYTLKEELSKEGLQSLQLDSIVSPYTDLGDEENAVLDEHENEPNLTKISTKGLLSLKPTLFYSITRQVDISLSLNRFNKLLNDEEASATMKELNSYDKKLLSVVRIANLLVDEVISESLKSLVGKSTVNEKESYESLNTFETEIDHPSIFDFASCFVDGILNESFRRTIIFKLLGIERFQKYNSPEDFNVKDGLEIVAKCLSKWSFNHNWSYRTIYHGRMVSESHSYFYTVQWSVPTPSYPVAQVTADIHFTVEVMPMKPPPVYIQVWYRMETDRSQHNALSSNFFAKWLHSVLERKLKAFQMFTF